RGKVLDVSGSEPLSPRERGARPRSGMIAPTVSRLRRLGGLLAPHWPSLALAAGLTALAGLLNLPAPLLLQRLIDRLAAGGRAADVPAFALGLLAVAAVQAGAGLLLALVTGRVG